jgi:hypothetical protein|tara:strand:- start:380 stop:733 length:354 start_codon:yes stop_codon:yes gene_type:complete
MIQQLLGSIVGLGTSFLDSKAEIQKAKAVKEQKIAEGTANWETMAMDASKSSWKDELWTIVFVAILLANFIPWGGMQDIMQRGFENLSNCPEWVTWGIYASIASSFGLKTFSKIRRK